MRRFGYALVRQDTAGGICWWAPRLRTVERPDYKTRLDVVLHNLLQARLANTSCRLVCAPPSRGSWVRALVRPHGPAASTSTSNYFVFSFFVVPSCDARILSRACREARWEFRGLRVHNIEQGWQYVKIVRQVLRLSIVYNSFNSSKGRTSKGCSKGSSKGCTSLKSAWRTATWLVGKCSTCQDFGLEIQVLFHL